MSVGCTCTSPSDSAPTCGSGASYGRERRRRLQTSLLLLRGAAASALTGMAMSRGQRARMRRARRFTTPAPSRTTLAGDSLLTRGHPPSPGRPRRGSPRFRYPCRGLRSSTLLSDASAYLFFFISGQSRADHVLRNLGGACAGLFLTPRHPLALGSLYLLQASRRSSLPFREQLLPTRSRLLGSVMLCVSCECHRW